MSYPALSGEDDAVKLLKKKELFSLRADPFRNFRDPPIPDDEVSILLSKHLKIHSHQLFDGNLMNPDTPYTRLHLLNAPGTGKCHGIDTPILMFDGTVKMVQDVVVGDQLMGDDSTPRRVLSLARGRETMYKVIPVKGDPFVCNKSHILSLVSNDRKNKGQIVDISIRDYLDAGSNFKHRHKLFKVPVEFADKEIEIPPYMLGFWLGDGCSYNCTISTQDAKIVQYFTPEVVKFGAYFRYKSGYDYDITTGNHGGEKGCNRFLATLQKYNLLQNKRIPHVYKCNSREKRLQLLAGLLDSDGFYDKKSNVFEFVQKNEKLLDDVVYLARSLGFMAYKTPCIKRCTNSKDPNHQGTYYRTWISGDIEQIPTILDRKRAASRKLNKNVLRTGFILEELPENDYYGFTLDGNHRYLLGDFTVTHNTLAAIYIASRFMKIYRRMYQNLSAKIQATRKNYPELDKNTPTIFVLGFGGTKSAFIRDLLKYPEFGFITPGEKEELGKRQKAANSGFPDDIRHLKEYYGLLRKRITNKSKDGFFKFYGYDEFVNRLFVSGVGPNGEPPVKLTELETIASGRLRAGELGPSGQLITLEDVFREYIELGRIQVNTGLVAMFQNSLLICDEIHNTYNMNMKNNRGVAIQYILDSVPSLRFLSLSATPINNSPTEVVELVNYLVPRDKKITKRGFFKDSRTLHPGKLEEIGRMLLGRISYLQDTNIKYYPRREIMGVDLILPHDVDIYPAGSAIPYLKFIPCPMSDFHQRTYQKYLETATAALAQAPPQTEAPAQASDAPPQTEAPAQASEAPAPESETRIIKSILEEALEDVDANDLEIDSTNVDMDADTDDQILGLEDKSYYAIPTDGYSIYDIAFPNPDSTEYGLFRSSEVKSKLMSASQQWRDENKILVKKYSVINNLITGDFLTRENIAKYSTKYAQIIDTTLEIMREAAGDPDKCQKIMIYHDRVKMSGVLLIQELLLANGFIGELNEPVDGTRCCICTRTLAEHQGEGAASTSHQYRPARFVVAHSDIDKITMGQSIDKFIAPNNSHGQDYMILIGSKIIKESYDLKDIQNVIMVSLPTNIPTMIQVFGRSIRKNSHINLPVEQRRVRIFILVSVVNGGGVALADPISPEMYRYIDKISDYRVIQNIEREINRGAIDGPIHRDIVMSNDILKVYFPGFPIDDSKSARENEQAIATAGISPQEGLGHLYFRPAIDLPQFEPNNEAQSQAGEGSGALPMVDVTTFTAYKHYEDEIAMISSVIKRLFLLRRVYTYDDLWANVKAPPMGLEVNPRFFQESNFIIALHHLVSAATPIVSTKPQVTETMLVEKIFDYAERYIYVGGGRCKIEQVGPYYILFPVADLPANPLNVTFAEYLEHARDKERAMVRSLPEPTDRVIVDVETYLRPRDPASGVRISIDEFVKENREGMNFQSKRLYFMESYQARESYLGFLSEFSAPFQMKILEEAILYKLSGGVGVGEDVKGAAPAPAPSPDPKNRALGKVLDSVLELFSKFNVVVRVGEVRKYKDTVKQFKEGIPAKLTDATPIGYMTSKTVRLFDPAIDRWFEVSKLSLNRQITYKENEIIIGFLETAEDSTKFKLRKPIQRIREEIQKGRRGKKPVKAEEEKVVNVEDTRLIERGIVCVTKNKPELLQIIASLGISVSKLEKGEIRIKKLCGIIKNSLIESEIRERTKDGRYKYLYGWWDEPIDIAARI